MTVKEDAKPQSVVEPDSDSWYVLGGQFTEEVIFARGPEVYACREDKGPGAKVEALGPYGALAKLEDREVVAGKPVVVVFNFQGNQAMFVRGQRRCERMAAEYTGQAAKAFAAKKKEVDRYK